MQSRAGGSGASTRTTTGYLRAQGGAADTRTGHDGLSAELALIEAWRMHRQEQLGQTASLKREQLARGRQQRAERIREPVGRKLQQGTGAMSWRRLPARFWSIAPAVALARRPAVISGEQSQMERRKSGAIGSGATGDCARVWAGVVLPRHVCPPSVPNEAVLSGATESQTIAGKLARPGRRVTTAVQS